ncbi:MAG TPA: isochorismatase family protein [Fimbriimonadaceae bacterium]|nr:isochorismatase family protein [Fimbriimonadaceae bacterium]
MPITIADPTRSIVLAVDLQPSFLKAIHEAERVLARSTFLVRVAGLLDVPVFTTEQNPERMGGTHPDLALHLPAEPIPKMTFSCVGCTAFDQALAESGRNQAVLVGIETHICVSQTAHHLLRQGLEVIVCADAVSSRTLDRHKLGMERIRDAGAVPAHTESIAYEWLGTAEHPLFRQALQVVKETA